MKSGGPEILKCDLEEGFLARPIQDCVAADPSSQSELPSAMKDIDSVINHRCHST